MTAAESRASRRGGRRLPPGWQPGGRRITAIQRRREAAPEGKAARLPARAREVADPETAYLHHAGGDPKPDADAFEIRDHLTGARVLERIEDADHAALGRESRRRGRRQVGRRTVRRIIKRE